MIHVEINIVTFSMTGQSLENGKSVLKRCVELRNECHVPNGGMCCVGLIFRWAFSRWIAIIARANRQSEWMK